MPFSEEFQTPELDSIKTITKSKGCTLPLLLPYPNIPRNLWT